MTRLPYGKYSQELKEEAVQLITKDGMNPSKVSQAHDIPKSTVEHWFRLHKRGKLTSGGKGQKPLTEMEVELARVKRELAKVKMERDILKKAAVYFAKESL